MLDTLRQWTETTFSSYCQQMTTAIAKDTKRRKSMDREIIMDLRSSSSDDLTLFGETVSWSLVAHDIDADRVSLDDVKSFYEKLKKQYDEDDLVIRSNSPALRRCDYFVIGVIPEIYEPYNDDLSRVEECLAVSFSTFKTNQRVDNREKSLKRYDNKVKITLMNMFDIKQFSDNVPERDQQRVIYQYVKQVQLTYPRFKRSGGGWNIPRNIREKGSIEIYNSALEWLTNPILRAQIQRMSQETLQQLRSSYKDRYEAQYRELRERYPRSIKSITSTEVYKYNPTNDFPFLNAPYKPFYTVGQVNQAIEKAVLTGFDGILSRLEKCENPKEYNEYLQEKIYNDNEIYPIPSRIDQFYHLLDQGFYVEQYGDTTDWDRYHSVEHVQVLYLSILKQVSDVVQDLPGCIEINDQSKEEYKKQLNEIQVTAMAQDRTIRDNHNKFRQQYKEIAEAELNDELAARGDAYKRVYSLLKLKELYVQEQAFYQIKTQMQAVTKPSTGSLSALVGGQSWKSALREEINLQRQKIHTIVTVNNKSEKVIYWQSPDEKHSELFVTLEKRNQELYNEYKESVHKCKNECDKYHELLIDLEEGLEAIMIKGERQLDRSLVEDVIPGTPLNQIEGQWCIPISWIAPSLISKTNLAWNHLLSKQYDDDTVISLRQYDDDTK